MCYNLKITASRRYCAKRFFLLQVAALAIHSWPYASWPPVTSKRPTLIFESVPEDIDVNPAAFRHGLVAPISKVCNTTDYCAVTFLSKISKKLARGTTEHQETRPISSSTSLSSSQDPVALTYQKLVDSLHTRSTSRRCTLAPHQEGACHPAGCMQTRTFDSLAPRIYYTKSGQRGLGNCNDASLW